MDIKYLMLKIDGWNNGISQLINGISYISPHDRRVIELIEERAFCECLGFVWTVRSIRSPGVSTL